jgi:alpha-tubulin suppressor-like RCC1 family protein
MWGWGDGNNYRTGINTTTDNSSPVQCGVGTGFVQLSMGETHGHAVKSDGTLWCWGNGGDQKNGNGSTAEIQTPSQVGSDTDWKQCSSGYTHGMAIKTDNTLYGWGENGNGEVGTGTTSKVTFPTQIGSDTWLKVSTKLGTPKGTYAVKSDNTLWSWGSGASYNLGHGGGTSYSAPQQVGTDTDWNDVFDGSRNYSGTIAFKGPKINPS